MGSTNIRDILTSFSPSLDFFAISSGDGRIKIWDTLKGQVQTEFADIATIGERNYFAKPEGHLSVDYKCMKWLSLDKKKKRKLGSSLLVLGTGSGDVLALDVSAGQLKWRVSDCHPGGVTAISFPKDCSCVYSSGVDGMICELDSITGNMLGKFRASTKAIYSMSVSSDGKYLATAASQLKIFSCSERKKLQKCSGHPGAVRCLIFSEDGKFVISSSVGERYVAIWKIDGSKKKSAYCVLAMDHPAVVLDSKSIDNGVADDSGLSVVAISEMGVCYFWSVKTIDELQNSKGTKVLISLEDQFPKNHRGAVPIIFDAKIQGIVKPVSGLLFIAYGLLIRPSFEKIVIQPGLDTKLTASLNGILVPFNQTQKSKKGIDPQNQIVTLDRANAEGALLPVSKIHNMFGSRSGAKPSPSNGDLEIDEVNLCLEDRLRSLGILSSDDDLTFNLVRDSRVLTGIDLEANMPRKKMRAAVLSMVPNDAYKLLNLILDLWLSRSLDGKYVLPWISCILLIHSDYIKSHEPSTELLDSLYKLTKTKGEAVPWLLQLSGRLQLMMAQIGKASEKRQNLEYEHQHLVVESEDEDIGEFLYGEEDEESESISDEHD